MHQAAPFGEECKRELSIHPCIRYIGDIAASLSISEAGKVAAKNIAKAVGDMEKDTAIHRYQYLVKTNTEVAKADDKGLENFTL